MILKECNYYQKFIGKKVKINFYNPDNNYCIGILKNLYGNSGVDFEITFILSPKMMKKKPLEYDNELWELENVTCTDQDQIFENYYWSNLDFTHCIVSNLIKSIELVISFEEDLNNWKTFGPVIKNKYLKINFPFVTIVREFFEGNLFIEI
jgi:hypothetical protein|tara:strand:- start:32 stop:484 length:453 start_codon:yes stop_codon:yes gene_type:complete